MASAGRVLPLPKGAYSSSTTYHLLDFVSYQGSTYICKQTSTGNAPTNTTYWQIMAQGTESASVAGNYYGTCSTGASTSAKIVSIPATENFVLQIGDIIGIKFDNTNTANNPSLNVNNSGAKPIYYNNSAVSTSNLWASGEANRVTIFMYDGTNWIWMGHDVDIDTDTLSDLKDTTISSASNGQVLMYDSTSSKWKNQTPTTTLVGLSDTQISSATDGQVLKYNSTSQKWVNGEDKGGILPHLIVISETGSTVTATKGQTVITATETSTGHFECDLPEFGTWTIDAILGGDDAQVSLVVDTVKVYTVDDSHFHTDITVTYPSGATCSCSKSGEATLYATGSPYTFTVHSSGTWTITCAKGGVTRTQTVNVSSSGQTFSVNMTPTGATVTPTDDVETLCACAGIWDSTIATISDLLADSTSLLGVISSNNAIDYLARSTTFASDVCANQTAMSVIGLNNYASNTLLADADWLNGICNSEYFDSVLNVKVPTMTSNTTPSGECFITASADTNRQPYVAFNPTSTSYSPYHTDVTNASIGYKFTSAKKVLAVWIKQWVNSAGLVSSYKIQGSNDGSTWNDVSGDLTISNPQVDAEIIESFTNTNNYIYYRVKYLSQVQAGQGFAFAKLQFYGREDV